MHRFAGRITVLLLFAMAAMAAMPGKSVKWLDDFKAAKADAKKKGVPILADFTGSDWCPWCVKLEKEVFSQKAFLDYASTNLVLFVADFPRRKKLPARVAKQNEELQEKFKVGGFPTVLLLDADGNVLEQTGYVPGGADVYVTNLKALLAKSGRTPGAVTNQAEKAAVTGSDAPVLKPAMP